MDAAAAEKKKKNESCCGTEPRGKSGTNRAEPGLTGTDTGPGPGLDPDRTRAGPGPNGTRAPVRLRGNAVTGQICGRRLFNASPWKRAAAERFVGSVWKSSQWR
ncbi:hypothetical protein WMY93_004580 [Mugilogobius chulae]|uniref:Uncharacterized protein n=1 Tax=Mugilogobius chulae TaxID=88201 RepID=A0AAW0PPD5_9GOBI